MERSPYTMSTLFAQLGEAHDAGSIARFIAEHRCIPGSMRLHEASFWRPAQADFLREAMQDDADWSEIVDCLNVELHA